MPHGIRDYYAILGVERGCSEADIKKAFRAKARECHPDVCDTDDGEDRFKAINEAYEVLSDSRKRDVYDRFGTTDPRAGGFDSVQVEDIFGMGIEDVFSMFFGGQRPGRHRVRHEGRDLAARVAITLAEAASGVEREIDLTRDAACEDCGATGGVDGTLDTCPDCGGSGQRTAVRQTLLGTMRTTAPCERCGQTGQVMENPCETCRGSGRAPKRERVTVPVSPGVHDGMGIRLPGMGEAGLRGATSGDLIVNVRVAPHEHLFRDGDDLHVQVRVPMTVAALGGNIRFQGLMYEEEIKVPHGTQHGDVLRLKGRGMPRVRGGAGDLMAHVAVDVPRRLSKEEKRLIEEVRESRGDGAETVPVDRVSDWLGRR